MSKWLLLLLPFIGGLAGGAQAPINGALGKRVGPMEATLLSFFVGTLAAALLVLLLGKGELGKALQGPRWQLVGGMLGLVFVLTVVMAVPRLGAAETVFAAIAGQMVMSLVADHFALFGLQRIPINALRIVGLALMAGGVFLVSRSD